MRLSKIIVIDRLVQISLFAMNLFCLLSFIIPFISATIVCPQNTYFLSNQSVKFEAINTNWSYFAVDISKNIPIKLKIKVNQTSYLYRGNGLYCPNLSWLPSYKKLKSRRDTTVSVNPSFISQIKSHKSNNIQTFGVFTPNITQISISVIESGQYKYKTTSTSLLSIILITTTLLLFAKYIMSSHNS